MSNFGGTPINFVQIGLGSNRTLIQNLDGREYHYGLARDFGTCSEHCPTQVRGIAVEPVEELVKALRPIASNLPGVELLQAAMGEHDESQVIHIGLSSKDLAQFLESVPKDRHEEFIEQCEYLKNMSCTGSAHPLRGMLMETLEYEFGVKLNWKTDTSKVDVWSWGKLVETFNFVGCEFLLVDAEGWDAKILRSMISYCSQEHHNKHWPDLIVFETMGHCDRLEGCGAEAALLEVFTKNGFTVVAYSDHDSYVLKTSALEKERLQCWVNSWGCHNCRRKRLMPYVSTKLRIDKWNGYRVWVCETCYNQLLAKDRCTPLTLKFGNGV